MGGRASGRTHRYCVRPAKAGTSDTEDLGPGDAFELIANETRLEVVRVLAEASVGERSVPLSFSELRRRVGMRDSGGFNYHLDRLEGTFVRKTEDGYRLRYPGTLLYRMIASGYFTARPEVDPFETGSACFDCGTVLRVAFSDATFEVECPDCGREYQGTDFPPSGTAHRSGVELLYAFDQYVRRQVLLIARGICYWCTGPMSPEVQRRTDAGLAPEGGEVVFIARTCEHCGGFMFTLPGECVLYHPAVVSFFHERGVDVTERPLWELDFVSDPARTTVRSEDPWRIGVTVSCDGDEMEVVIDGQGEVVGVGEGRDRDRD